MPMPDQFSTEAVKSAIATSLAAISALTLDKWVMIGTGVYLVMQGAYLLRKWWREEKDWARRKGRKP